LGQFALPVLLPNVATLQWKLGIITALIVPAMAAVWYLLTSLKAFKTSTKIAYYIITLGIFFYAFTQLGVFLFTILGVFFPSLTANVLTANVLIIPYALSPIILFVGIRKLAKQLGIRSKWMSWLVVLGCVIAIALASLLLPRTPDPDPDYETSVKVIIAVLAGLTGFGIAATAIAVRIRDSISSTYKGAMGWLSVASGAFVFGTFHEFIIKGTDLANSGYVTTGVSVWPVLLAGLLFMKAGQAIKVATFKKLADNATYVDAVVYAASLVSNPHAVDQTLNELRQVTAGLQSGGDLQGADKKKLLDVYRKLEVYLVTKEPLRKLSQPELRARLTAGFQEELTTSESGARA
jgi:hypothetical protein